MNTGLSGDAKGAAKSYGKALEIGLELVRASPRDNESRRYLARGYKSRGEVDAQLGNPSGAEKDLKQATEILEALMRHAGDVLSRFDLLEQVWGYDYENRSNIVEVYIRYLRENIDRPFGRNTLQTVRGVGYRVCAD